MENRNVLLVGLAGIKRVYILKRKLRRVTKTVNNSVYVHNMLGKNSTIHYFVPALTVL